MHGQRFCLCGVGKMFSAWKGVFLLSSWKAVLKKGIREGGYGAFYMIPNLSCLWACVCLSASFKGVERVCRRKHLYSKYKKIPRGISSLGFSPPFVCGKKKESHRSILPKTDKDE